MTYLIETSVKPSQKGTPVPHHPGLKLFSFNAPCQTCRMAANLELDGERICSYDYVRLRKGKK